MIGRPVSFSFLTALIFIFCSCTDNKKEGNSPDESEVETAAYETDSILHFTSGIRSLFEDSKGNIWFGSVREGVARFDGEIFTYFDESVGLSNNQVRSIAEDQQGTIWFETSEGISSFQLNTILANPPRNYSFKESWSLDENDLWFKADPPNGYNQWEGQPGVYQYNGQSIFFRAFPIEQKQGEQNYYTVTTPTLRAADGSVWWGTYGAAIGYNGSDFKILNNEYFYLNEETGFLHIRALFEDSEGNLWVGNNGIGPIKLTDDDFTILKNEHPEMFEGVSTLVKVFSIGEDQSGSIWFGTAGSGVWKYDGETFTNFAENEGIPSKHIWAIYPGESGELWFAGENPSGVYVFDGKRFIKKF